MRYLIFALLSSLTMGCITTIRTKPYPHHHHRRIVVVKKNLATPVVKRRVIVIR